MIITDYRNMGCPKLTERDFFRLGNRTQFTSRGGAEKQSVEVKLTTNLTNNTKNKTLSASAEQNQKNIRKISSIRGSKNLFSCNGNKNIIALLDKQGKMSANFAYSPYGKQTLRSGTAADECSFGFSSEYLDKETGLIYYNYRYYSPEIGRWLSRDPIGELGGYNLYAMLSNKTVNKTDLNGYMASVWLKSCKCCCAESITFNILTRRHF
jgi:RHS repeat-associated protein